MSRHTKETAGDPGKLRYNVKFRADTWLQLTADPGECPGADAKKAIDGSAVDVVPRVDERREDIGASAKLLTLKHYLTDAIQPSSEKIGKEEQVEIDKKLKYEQRRKWPRTYAEMHRRALENEDVHADSKVKSAARKGLAPLFRRRGEAIEVRTGARHGSWLLVVPDEKTQEALIDQAHMEVGAHANARTMERELRRKYWWWNMREMCDDKVNSCEHCQRYKNRRDKTFALSILAIVCLVGWVA